LTKLVTMKVIPKSLMLVILSVLLRNANAENNQEYAVRAGLTANFARFTSWPNDVGKDITLCLAGDPALEEAFLSLSGKAIGDKTLQIRYLSRFNNLAECQLLYISELDKNKLLFLFNEIKSLPILTLGENDFFIKNGGMVSIQIIDGKVSLSINLKATKKSSLSISARVLKLATVIQ
jgi:hypothetical protein